MRLIALGILLASLVCSAGVLSVAPATAGDYGYRGSSNRYVTYQSSCCYRKVIKKIVKYQRVGRYDDGGYGYGRPRYRNSYRSDGYNGYNGGYGYNGYNGGYGASSYRYRSYSQPYRYPDAYDDYDRLRYRSYPTRYDDSYDRPRYRSYRVRYHDRPYGDGYYD